MSIRDRLRRAKAALVKTTVSLIAVGFILAHILRPTLRVDAITIALVVIGILPWFYSVIESAKLPGGYEIKFRDISKAGEKLGGAAEDNSASTEPRVRDQPSILEKVQSIDPNLAVAGLRIEIEKSIRKIAEAHGIANGGPLITLVGTLSSRGVLPAVMADGIKSLIRIGNSAVHGASVDPAAAEWAILANQQIMKTLNQFLENRTEE